jgi:phospholipid/cholesterol/gamma-HCH transport system substrate-binding protein
MKNERKQEFKVGLFAAGGILLFIFTVILLGGDRAFFTKHRHLTLVLDSVEGLNAGSSVQLSGLKVGNIQSLSFIPEKNELRAVLLIEAQYASRVTEGSTAGVRTQGALGDKFVYITPGPLDAPELKENAFVVAETSHDLFSTLAAHGGDLKKVFDILDELHRFSQGLNTNGGSPQLMRTVNASAEELHKATAQLNGMLGEMKTETLPHLNNILAKVDRGQGTLGALINDSSIHDRLKDFLGGADHKKQIRNLIRGSIEQSEK